MTCDEARGRLAGLALGELDAEVQADVERHAAGCDGCREERDAVVRATGALRSATPLAGSTERREAAERVMTNEHRERVAWLLSRPRRPWLPWVAAAALVAALAFFLVPGPRETFNVASVAGAEVDRGALGRWAALAEGAEVLSGDRVLVPQEGRVILESGGARVTIEGDASFLLVGRRIALERGRLHAESAGDVIEISDPGNNVVRIVDGTISVSLRQVATTVAGSTENPGGRDVPKPTVRTSHRLYVRVAEGEAVLEGSHAQRLRAEAGREGKFDFSGQPGLVPVNEQE